MSKIKAIVKSTVIKDEDGKERTVEETYTLEQINYGISHCNHLIPQIEAEKGHNWEQNLKAVQDELAVWEGYKKELEPELLIGILNINK